MDTELREALDYLRPQDTSYREWLAVGMALKQAGLPVSVWEQWSAQDTGRYHSGECVHKWDTFRGGSGQPLTENSIFAMAYEKGWPGPAGHALDWGDTICSRTPAEGVVVDANWLEPTELDIPDAWDPAAQLIQYLQTLFEAEDHVAYVTESFMDKDRRRPTRGCWDRTAGQLIAALQQCRGDVGAVLGDWDPEVGAWICFNPVDGRGRADKNITDYRYALVESDDMELGKQQAIIRQLALPCAALVYSGGKSMHAIVRVDAPDYTEYRKRVDYLYAACKRNGLRIDEQNRNPSRLSRVPGVTRNGQKQYLLATGIGKSCWAEWVDWVESSTDELPDDESLADTWDDLPPLAPPLIDGVLRCGHKMLLSGPSKAGKSFALIALCIAIAEGQPWMGKFACAQGKVLYINLELDRASCLHRFHDVYQALGIEPAHRSNIRIWNLRGASVPMDKLTPKLIRRAKEKGYLAVVLDPIYKVITGDENSADQMAAFCNQFDKVCRQLDCAAIYCHHHAKGLQGAKRSIDRASGSGVFARDPDAILDMTELTVTDAIRAQLEQRAAAEVCKALLDRRGHADAYSQDDVLSRARMVALCKERLGQADLRQLDKDMAEAVKKTGKLTAWRIEGTLREFAAFPAVNLWFEYPIHKPDTGLLEDLEVDGATMSYASKGRKGAGKRWGTRDQQEQAQAAALDNAYAAASLDGDVTIYGMAQFLGLTPKTVKARLKKDGRYWVEDARVGKKQESD